MPILTALAFQTVLQTQPDKIWSKDLPHETKNSVLVYKNHRKLSNGTLYGDVIRSLDLSALGCLAVIEDWAKAHECKKEESKILDGKTGKPMLDAHGHTYPIVNFLCRDGGVIRVKPVEDPTNPHDHKPTAVKAMRFFGKEKYESFQDEAFKVDNQGRAVPKSPADLELNSVPTKERPSYIRDWALDAHTELGPCVKP